MDKEPHVFSERLIRKHWKKALAYDAMADYRSSSSYNASYTKIKTTCSISFDPKLHLGAMLFLSHYKLADVEHAHIALKNAVDYALTRANTDNFPIVILSFVFFVGASVFNIALIREAPIIVVGTFLLLLCVIISAIAKSKRRYISGLFKHLDFSTNPASPYEREKRAMEEFENLCTACELEDLTIDYFVFRPGNKKYLVCLAIAFIVLAIILIVWFI